MKLGRGTYREDKCIDDLCEDRQLRTSEVFKWNSFYGIDKIVKKYTSLPETYSLKGIWPHGIVFDNKTVLGAEQNARLSTVFCYPPYRLSPYREKTDKIVIPSAHPFLYLRDMVGPSEAERKGTLFFPQHSTHHITADMNYKALAEKLVDLEEEYQPVTVCLYWKDYNMGRAQPFREQGLPVASAGHMFDPDFLFRFYQLCKGHQYAAGNGIGSHIFYSVAAGCSYFHLEGVDYEVRGEEDLLERDRAEPEEDIVRHIRQTFGTRPPSPIEKQRRKAEYFLGAEYKKTQAGLLADLVRAELLDKARLPPGEKDRIAQYFPTFWQREILPKFSGLKRRLVGPG